MHWIFFIVSSSAQTFAERMHRLSAMIDNDLQAINSVYNWSVYDEEIMNNYEAQSVAVCGNWEPVGN